MSAKKLLLIESAPKPYGEAHPRRGANHIDAALAFARAYPVGSQLSDEALDEEFEKLELLAVPRGKSRNSDAWRGHIQRRSEARRCINLAASHPRMRDSGADPFVIEVVREGLYEVQSPEVAIGKNKITKRVKSLCKTKKRQLSYLMQSADWDNLPPHERALAESIYDDIANLRDIIDLQAGGLEKKIENLKSKLRAGVQSGKIRAANPAIKRMLSFDGDN